MQIQVKRYRMLVDEEGEEELTLDHAERHNASFSDLVEFEFGKKRSHSSLFCSIVSYNSCVRSKSECFVFIFE